MDYQPIYSFERTLPVRPFALNHYQKFTRQGRCYKTTDAKHWEMGVVWLLQQDCKELKDLSAMFSPTCHGFAMSYRFYLKGNKIITKSKTISKKSGDTDNFIKPFQDRLFEFIGIDDSVILHYPEISKLPALKNQIYFKLELFDFTTLKEFSDSI